jgi:acetolactate synthase-1/2/3 large subunit
LRPVEAHDVDPYDIAAVTADRTAAAELLTILHDEGVRHLFVNPGSHLAPVRAALAEADAAGLPHPSPVVCGHEHVALSAAHGHHVASGGSEAVMVHLDGGDLDLRAAIENAERDRIPVTIFSDAPGLTERSSRTPGKWTADPARDGDLNLMVRRAFQISRAEPRGLTHIVLTEHALGRAAGAPSRRLLPPRPSAPNMAALEEMAELLAAAESPAIVAGRVGRHLDAVRDLARLAETLGAPVIDFRYRVNLPPRHPLNASPEARDLLLGVDAILMLDVEAPCVSMLGPLPPQSWLLQIDTDCLKAAVPGWHCPVEIAITADTHIALPQLRALVADRLSPRQRQAQQRRRRVEASLQSTRDRWADLADGVGPEGRVDAVIAELDRALPDDAVVLEEAGPNAFAVLRQMERPPGQFFRRVATAPGWSIGAAFGASLARPAQPVVALCDGAAFEHGLPAAAFWSAHRERAPFLAVVVGEAPSDDALEAESDVVAVARAAGAAAEIVREPAEIPAAVERLLATTRDGVCAVLDARLLV